MPYQIQKTAEESVELFKSGLYCSEAILQVYNKHLKLGLNEAAIKMSTAFGAGLGASKCTCGSLTGAVLVLSALKGRTSPEESVDEIFALTSELHNRFKEKYKSTCCRVLTKDQVWGEPSHHQYCEQFVYGAAEILNELIENKIKGNEK